MAACAADVSVAKLAMAHGLNANMVFKWRRELRAGLFDGIDKCSLLPVSLPAAQATLNPVDSASPAAVETSCGADGRLEIELNGACVRVHGTVDPIQLRLVLRCLMPL